MPSARIWRCARQNFAGSAASSALSSRVLQEGVASASGVTSGRLRGQGRPQISSRFPTQTPCGRPPHPFSNFTTLLSKGLTDYLSLSNAGPYHE